MINARLAFAALLLGSALPVSAAATASAPAPAALAVELNNQVFVERTTTDADGKAKVTLSEPKLVVPGDQLVFRLTYRNRSTQPATSFVVTNPLPSAVRFQGSADAAAEVSVDGGRSFGRLAQLTVKDGAGERPAVAADVTHIRWAFAEAIPAGGSGQLMFRGVVR